MAVIGSIRKHSTILLIVVAIALLAFILGDFTKKNYQDKTSERFIIVGKEALTYRQFTSAHEAYKQLVKEYWMSQGREDFTLSPEDDFNLNNEVYNQLIDSMLFAMQANHLGITITNEELRDLVAGIQPHPLAARFFGNNPQLAQRFLDNLAQYDTTDVKNYLRLERDIEKDAFRTKYLNLLTGAYYIPKAFARKMQEEMQWKAELEIVQVPYSSPLVSDDKITVTDSDIKKWYEANKFRFKQEQEFREVDYVIFNVQPSESDLREIEENVAELYEEFKVTEDPKLFVNRMVDARFDSTYYKAGQLPLAIDTALFRAQTGSFVEPYIDGKMWTFAKLLSAETRPDSICVSFILVANEGLQQDVRRKKEESAQIVDSAFHAVMSGIDFYEAATRYSDYPMAQLPDSGRIWFIDGSSMGFLGIDAQNFFDTLYPFNKGAIIKRELPGAVLIFKLHEKTVAERKIQVAIGKKAIEPSTETVENIESAANNFANGTDDYKKFTDAVVKHNLNKRTSNQVEKMTYALPGTNGSGCRDIIKWIYDDKTQKGNVSTVYSLENMYVVVVLKEIHSEGYRPLENEQVKGYAEMMAKRDKKAEMLEEMLKKSVSEKASLAKIAEKHNTEVESGMVAFGDRNFNRFGPEGKVIGQIFSQKDATTAVYKGDMGVYVVKINKFETPTMDVENNDAYNNMYVQQNTMMYQRRIFENSESQRALKKMYKIEDNRFKIY